MTEIVRVGSIDGDAVTSDVRDPDGNIIHKGNAPEGGQCWYNGTAYSDGARICQEGKIKVCDQWGTWNSTYETC